jgi:hypothetical protein
MARSKLIIAVGLQRSGNHAILNWVRSLFPDTAFLNDQDHALFADEAGLRARLAENPTECTIISFEDSANRTDCPEKPLLDSLAPLPPSLEEEYEVHRIIILRDPYNTWASRVTANSRPASFGPKLSSDPSWDLYRRNWLSLAGLAGEGTWRVVLFNRWKDDAAYRRELAAALGGTYSEETLDGVSREGGGSSFEGRPRPSYSTMLKKRRKYLSGRFLQRLVSRPSYYVQRFIAPPAKGGKMKVEKRWEALAGRSEGAALFADSDLREVTARLFGAESVPRSEV